MDPPADEAILLRCLAFLVMPASGRWHDEGVDDVTVHPYTMGGSYVNFMMDEGEDRVRATYGDSFERLVDVKRAYDSTNLFRVNQNIAVT